MGWGENTQPRNQAQVRLLDDLYQAVTDYLTVGPSGSTSEVVSARMRMVDAHARVKRSAFMSQTTVDI